jgi:signal peptidase I
MIDPALDVMTESPLALMEQTRFGDRVLVLKSLYPFVSPKRWDVVVFKNPTDPVGDAQNYIKRLVGLPDEKLLIVDGDVFTCPRNGTVDTMRIQRKPEHVQRAVWQKVEDTDWRPIDPASIEQLNRKPWRGPAWSTPGWTSPAGDPRTVVWNSSDPTTVSWDSVRRGITDWNAYNMLRDVAARGPFVTPMAVSDVRVAAALEATDPARLRTRLELAARGHLFLFELAEGQATLSIRRDGEEKVLDSRSAPCSLGRPGRPIDIEFWQVDQRLAIYVDGAPIVELPYEWSVPARVGFSFSGTSMEDYAKAPSSRSPSPPKVSWSFSGSPLTLHRLRLDRDLYYRQGRLAANEQFRSNGAPIDGRPYFATDPEDLAELDDDHFLMLGDNSAASRDGRAWGRPHPLVAAQIGDDSPFRVHRRLLLGKACAVYFPSPLPFSPGGRKLVPDFGRLRFIR